jgi:hypothetical protein
MGWSAGAFPGFTRERQAGGGADAPYRSVEGGQTMVTKRRGLLGLIATGLAAFLFPGKSLQANAAAASQAGQSLEGSWISTVSILGLQALRITTYNSNGTLVTTAPSNAPPLESSIGGTGHGSWVRTGDRQFATTWIGLRFDANGNFVGTAKLRGRIQVNEQGDESTGQTQSESFDRDGNLVATATSTGQAKRIVVELAQ